MKSLGNTYLPFDVNISVWLDQIENKQQIVISCILNHKFSYIYLENVRPYNGKVAEYTKYHYDGKPLWCLKKINGHFHLGQDTIFLILDHLNTRPLLADVGAIVMHQFKQIPIDIRQLILQKCKTQPKISHQDAIYSILQSEYSKQYKYLLRIFNSYNISHPFIFECKLIESTLFLNKLNDEKNVTKYLYKLIKDDFSFDNEYTIIYDKRFHTHVISDMFTYFENSGRLNKVQWFKYIKLHMNAFYIIKALLVEHSSILTDYTFDNTYIYSLSELWITHLRNNGFLQSGKIK